MNSEPRSGLEITQLSPRFFVCGQITEDDLNAIAEQGFKSIVNNRPDNEADGQPQSADLAAAATALDMEFVHVPVVYGSISSQDVNDFERVCENLEGPILMFCRTGGRSATLWKAITD